MKEKVDLQATCSVTQEVTQFLILLALAAPPVGSPIQQAPQTKLETSQEEFLSWVQESAIPVEPWQSNAELEAYLDRALKGKRIVFIGEPGHFFSERQDVQLLFIRSLVRRGYRHLFLEGLGASNAPVMDAYLQTGKPPVAGDSKRQQEAQRYRERAFESWVGAKGSDFQKRRSADRQRFLDALREIQQSLPETSPPLRIHPLDIDMQPGACYGSMDEILALYPEEPALDWIRSQLAKIEGESIQDEIQRLEQLKKAMETSPDQHFGALSAAHRLDLFKFLDCLIETIVFFDSARTDGSLNRALVRREPAMYRQVQYGLDSLPKGAKAIMIGHNNHLCRASGTIPRARKPSMGERIVKANPGQVFCIWMLHDHGWLLNPMAKEPIERLDSDPSRVESLLAKAGSLFLLPLGSGKPGESYLAKPRRHSYFSWSETSTLSRQTDAIFFLEKISPLHE